MKWEERERERIGFYMQRLSGVRWVEFVSAKQFRWTEQTRMARFMGLSRVVLDPLCI